MSQKSPGRRSILATLIRRRDGSMVIEFAIVGPVLILFLFGLVEFARYTYTQSALNFAAEEATRYAVVRGGEVTNDEILAIARDNLLLLNSGLAAVCVLSPTDIVTQTSTVSVSIDYSYQPIFDLIWPNMTLTGISEGHISFTPIDPDSSLSGDCSVV
ncbi:MAG TPA: TadE/TadG family type IV pilus assembly protein [Kiloniellaceae bacterium]|nr:TadE/TadG family type IV pilus assembly protein [Kiloniellaceae bacterium]